MHSVAPITSILAGFAAVRGALAGFDASSKSNVAVYWGQNSYGQSSGDLAQQRLSYYCSNSNLDIIPLAFMTVVTDQYDEPELNFANQGNNCTLFSGTALFYCADLEEDIATCQDTYDKTIILSVGGATYTEGGFSTVAEATSAAQLVWDTFGPENSTSDAYRPFGASAIDGFDFDFESTVTNMQPFASTLRTLMDAATDGKSRILTAAPQCPYPDAADDQMLSGGVYFDAIFVQFYNNYCGVQSYVDGSTTQNNFNFATWDSWANTTSANPDVKVLLGVPASATAAGSGYLSATDLTPIIEYCEQFASFGGVMMWDVSQAYGNSGFLAAVKSELTSAAAAAAAAAQTPTSNSTAGYNQVMGVRVNGETGS